MASAEHNFLQLLNQHRGIVHKIAHLCADTAHDQQDLYNEIVVRRSKLGRGSNNDRPSLPGCTG